MITDADSTLGVEASQETFQEMCEGIVKEVGPAIYNEIISAKLATRMKIRVAGATNQTGYCNAALGRRQFGQVTIQN